MSELKIISWNVNGIRTRIKNKDVNPVLEKEADIILFQETKTDYEKMDKKFLDKCGYEYYFLKDSTAIRHIKIFLNLKRLNNKCLK